MTHSHDIFGEEYEQKFKVGDVVQVAVETKSLTYFKRNQMVVNSVSEHPLIECFWTESTQSTSPSVPRFVSFKFHVSLLEAVAPEDIQTGKAATASRE